jgi:hypothetical protein
LARKRSKEKQVRRKSNYLCHKYGKTELQHSQKLLDAISNVATYKFNMQDSVAFPYTNKKHAKKEIKKTIQTQ